MSAKDYEIKILREENEELKEEVSRLKIILKKLGLAQAEKINRKKNKLMPKSHTVEDKNLIQVRKIGKGSSIESREELAKIELEKKASIGFTVSNMIEICKNPLNNIDFLSSEKFALEIIKLCREVKFLLEKETRCLYIQSPVYVLGDIHGNLEDLHFFSDNIWNLGMDLTSGNFLFLGDYFDRGVHSLEVIAYMIALKIQCPEKMFMIRGNHELREVNGWEAHYGDKCFLWQSKNRFGEKMGELVWEEVNQVFDRLPLAAIIDNDIFCVHGGIPRPRINASNRIEDILMVPTVAGISPFYSYESIDMVKMSSECLWSDPAKPEIESKLDFFGFGEGIRGDGAVCFGKKAVNLFLEEHGFSYIIRAHEAHSEGVSVSKGAKVLTVFSTSKDHNQGNKAMAGCLLIDSNKIHIINRSPNYKNRIIKRKGSAIGRGMGLPMAELGYKLGLLVDAKSYDEFSEGKKGYSKKCDFNEGLSSPANSTPGKILRNLFGNNNNQIPLERVVHDSPTEPSTPYDKNIEICLKEENFTLSRKDSMDFRQAINSEGLKLADFLAGSDLEYDQDCEFHDESSLGGSIDSLCDSLNSSKIDSYACICDDDSEETPLLIDIGQDNTECKIDGIHISNHCQ